MDSNARSYGGLSAEQRRVKRRAELLDAALDLAAEGGVAKVTKKAVCERAGLNDRYFYEQFTDRDSLLTALIDETAEQGIRAVLSAVGTAEEGPEAKVHTAADAVLAFLTADMRRTALVVGPYDEVLQRARISTQHSISAAMAALSRTLVNAPAHDGGDIQMVAYAVVSGVIELVAAWLRGEFTVARDELRDLISAMMLASITLTDQLSGVQSE